MKDGGSVKATIPADAIDGIDKCGGSKPPTATVDNLTLNGKPPEK